MKDYLELGMFQKFVKDVRKDFNPETGTRFNRSEIDLLSVLSVEKGKTFRFYNDHVKLEKGSFTYLVDLLVEKGMIVSLTNSNDRRKKTLELTDKGTELIENVNKQFLTYIHNKFAIFNKKDIKDLNHAFDIIERLDKKFMEN
ncbi:hypothetical protein RJI07_09055 [Mycoplasmatota bacterium WC30]